MAVKLPISYSIVDSFQWHLLGKPRRNPSKPVEKPKNPYEKPKNPSKSVDGIL